MRHSAQHDLFPVTSHTTEYWPSLLSYLGFRSLSVVVIKLRGLMNFTYDSIRMLIDLHLWTCYFTFQQGKPSIVSSFISGHSYISLLKWCVLQAVTYLALVIPWEFCFIFDSLCEIFLDVDACFFLSLSLSPSLLL